MQINRPKSKQPIPEHAKKVFKGILFDTYQWEQEMYDGSKRTFEKIKRPDTVVVFPVLPDGKIILADQEQPGRTAQLGALGGRVDDGEDILTAAKRELLEESGYEAEEFILWDARHPDSKIDWVIYTFIAKGLKKISEMDLDGGEKIKLFSLTLDELINLMTEERKSFGDKETASILFEARLSPEKMKELKELFKPLEK